MSTKEEIIRGVNAVLIDKVNELNARLKDLKDDLGADHKSSAGDKHETGRAMTQLEQEKLSSQLNNIITLRNALSTIDPNENHDLIRHGSIVKTNSGTFFFSIGLGKIEVGGKQLFCLTPTTPLGQLLIGKSKGDTFNFNGKSDIVLEVV